MKKQTKVKSVKAWGVYPADEKLTHYCEFYASKASALRRKHEYSWCQECGQCTGEDFKVQAVLISPIPVKRKGKK